MTKTKLLRHTERVSRDILNVSFVKARRMIRNGKLHGTMARDIIKTFVYLLKIKDCI